MMMVLLRLKFVTIIIFDNNTFQFFELSYFHVSGFETKREGPASLHGLDEVELRDPKPEVCGCRVKRAFRKLSESCIFPKSAHHPPC